MIDLEKVSGLPISVEDGENYHLKFRSPLAQVVPGIRHIKDMKPVLMDQTASSSRSEMYYMYRGVSFPEHAGTIKSHNLRYDITVIPPAMIGQEFNKTVGHYHPAKQGTPFAYPEVYEIIHGRAMFILQKVDQGLRQLVRVLSFEAKAGDKVVFPPNYGHAMMNIGNEVLVTANWVADGFESLYEPIARKHGMAYYVVKATESFGRNPYHFIPNAHYQNHPEVETLAPRNLEAFNIIQPKPMYFLGISNPKNLEFLTDPEKYAVELSSISS
ncbi:MAG: glucose-6-phosphate isomerase family protein [Acidobacteriaceae bacterium]